MDFKIIVAIDENNGIGKNNALPWKYSEDLKYFSKNTKGNNDYTNVVVMGRKTYESIGKPLPGRVNYVLSRTQKERGKKEGKVHYFDNYKSLIETIKLKKFNEVWIIGGEEIYKLFMNLDLVSEIYVTKIKGNYNCNAFFPSIDKNYKFVIDKEWHGTSTDLKFLVYKRKQ